jgi:hypothetical protein
MSSYFDRLPLYVTDVKSESNNNESFWNFPVYATTATPVTNMNHPVFVCMQQEHFQQEISDFRKSECQCQLPKKCESKEQKTGNYITYNEWVDNMLEEMYLNENGQHNGDKYDRGYWEHKNCQDNRKTKCENEEEELMFQLDLDWDIEKGRV